MSDGRPDNTQTASAPETGRWSFDEGVTAAFEDMLQKSIPQYEVMRKVVTDAACWLAEEVSGRNPTVVDLGASRGSALAPIVDRLGADARYLAYEISKPMLDVLQERFAREIELGLLKVGSQDLRRGFPYGPYGGGPRPAVVLSVLTLQFIPIEYRATLLAQIARILEPGGGLILVEKVLGEADESSRMLVDLYHDLKRGNGYEQEAIERKALALEGVLVPLTASFNEELLRRAGFDLVEQVWGYLNFRGWVAVRR